MCYVLAVKLVIGRYTVCHALQLGGVLYFCVKPVIDISKCLFDNFESKIALFWYNIGICLSAKNGASLLGL